MKTLIAAAMLLALVTPAHAEWFLIFDTWFCDVHDCGEGKPPHEDFVHRDTYATRKQCLAAGRRLVSDKTTAPYMSEEAANTPIGRISPRCEEGFALTSSAAEWDCDEGITATSSKGEFFISMGKVHEWNAYPDRGAVRWDFRNGEVRLNGRLCKQTN